MFSHSLAHATLEASLESIPYSVIHWTEGRIRLRISRLGKDAEYATRLERSLKTYPWVMAVSFNRAARSVTIHYTADQSSGGRFRDCLRMALQQAAAPTPEPYTTKQLAQRLGVPFQALNWRRSQVGFAEWSCSKDPQGMAWNYDPEAKCFYSCAAIEAVAIAPGDSKVEKIFQALAGATGGRLGGLLGKIAGEAIGLALLGTAGVIVGAEIGMMIGEIVGEELGSV
jgi:hypothetical protein